MKRPRTFTGLYYGVTVMAVALLTLAAIQSVSLAAGIVAICCYAVALRKAGVWRTMVGTSVLVSVLRSGPVMPYLSDTIWYALQFLPLVIAGAATLGKKTSANRRVDHAVVALMFVFAVVAVATTAISVDPSNTLPQSLLLVGITIFLTLTFTRRWTNAATIRGDISTLFWLITAIQAVGVISMLARQDWPLDPDYGRYRGLFSNANYAGVISAVAIIVGLYLIRRGARRIPVVAGMVVLLIAMVASGSRGAILALCAGIVALLLARSSRKVIVPLLFAAGFVAMVVVLAAPSVLSSVGTFFLRDASVANDPTSGRLSIYETMFAQFIHSPVVGTGYSTAAIFTGGAAAHNTYLSVLTETGLLGFAVFGVLIVCIILASRSGKASRPLVGVAVTVAVVELTESSMFGLGGPSALTFWLLVLAFAAYGRFLEEPTVEARGVRTMSQTDSLSSSLSPSRQARVEPSRPSSR